MADLRPPESSTVKAVTVKESTSRIKVWIFLAVAGLAVILVLLVLPKLVPEPVPESAKLASPVAQLQSPQVNTEADKRLKTEAEQALQQFLRMQAQPDLANAEVWMPADWQQAMQMAAAGDNDFGQGHFTAALKAYNTATAGLQSIIDQRATTMQQSLDAGWQFLQANAVAEASTAFTRVLAMQADHAEASQGLSRAEVREHVLQWMHKGEQAEISGQLEAAAAAYQQALQLDTLYQAASDRLRNIEAKLTEIAFSEAMGKALKALESGSLTTAGEALGEAEKIKPGDSAVSAARKRLLAARKQTGLYSLRRKAEALVRAENWAAAAETYQRALKLDPQAAFARNGLQRAQKKLKLHQQLDHYLADVTRLYSPDPLANALELLQANPEIPAAEARLTDKLKRLQVAVGLALIEVPLRIISDELTEVTVYKVGRLGRFGQKELSLRPGKYTLTGTRKGYRDVLKQIDLLPQSKMTTVTISAGEKF